MKKKKKLRLPYYDYKTPGWYFITICTKNREWYFGKINNNVIILSDIGDIVKNYWFKITEHNENIALDEFIVMPNHLHGIVIIKDDGKIPQIGEGYFTNLSKITKTIPIDHLHLVDDERDVDFRWKQQKDNLSTVLGGYKSAVSKAVHENITSDFNWQVSFYDHIIRDEDSLENIQDYIFENPLNWENDIEFLKTSDNKEIQKYYKSIFKYKSILK